MDYKTLNALPPKAFLNSIEFQTEFDRMPKMAKRQYAKGLDLGNRAKQIIICANGTWAAIMKDGSHVSSCEGIGYHANTAKLLQGFLDSGCEIWVFRKSQPTERIK